MSFLDPFSHALAAVVWAAHSVLTAVGLDPSGGTTWLLSVAVVVVAVRLALLPLVVHGVTQAHASARARPAMRELTDRYRGKRDQDSIRALMDERRRISAEHGISRWGCLPMLAQLPIWFALYHLLSDVAAGQPVGAMDGELVASFGAATVLGVQLAARGFAGSEVGVVVALAVTAAALSYVTQRYLVAPNTVSDGMPDAMLRAQELMPFLAAGGMLIAAGAVPVALLAYWVLSATWTLGQSAVVWRWFPTPGSPAALRHGVN
jgi:YidC/Oxa1 family membrane protein insertase